MLGGSAMRKNLFPFLIIGVVSLILPQYALCLSDDSSINVQYANYILEVGTFDINKLLNINKQVKKSKITDLYFSLPSKHRYRA